MSRDARACFNRLKQHRDLATRYAKRAVIYCGRLVLIAALIWLSMIGRAGPSPAALHK